ncbi:DUF4129 domain-containing protein [Jiangella asiatica]|uniref:DUF4129 domain-containing protein n=1 Tax=Jiangella asiatica TaxID=2530372 RepID=A0A4R5CKH4_9ACTN|nr:DUF4129 domain-containing protein [Jiangella asiatica]TDE00792.1 DUF4129 domain-containing protein [Jiangella asiatica]
MRRPGNLPAAAAVLLAAAIVVVLAAGVGPVEVVQPDWLSSRQDPPDLEPLDQPPPQELPTPLPERTRDEPPELDLPWQGVLLALLIAAAAALAVYLVRRLRPPGSGRVAPTVLGGELDELVDVADELRDGARAADAALSGGGSSGAQAVVEAWLALESAAAGSGAPRDAAQTPSEFTAALLRRHHADDAATATLLHLYQRARFAVRPDITDDDVAAARRALGAILATIGAPAPAGPR